MGLVICVGVVVALVAGLAWLILKRRAEARRRRRARIETDDDNAAGGAIELDDLV